MGKTGIQVSALGIGGYHLGSTKNQDEANAIVRVGVALQGLRNRVVLMSKVCAHGRDKKVAMRMLEESLRRLRTDHLDVWQIHEVVYWNDPDLIFAPDGAAEALAQAKREGKVRFVGFTGHKDPRMHLKMLSHDFPFDTVQMPLTCLDGTFRSFETQVLPALAPRYAMSLPVATTISGIDSIEVLRQNLEIARNFQPLTAAEQKSLRDRCRDAAADGHDVEKLRV